VKKITAILINATEYISWKADIRFIVKNFSAFYGTAISLLYLWQNATAFCAGSHKHPTNYLLIVGPIYNRIPLVYVMSQTNF